MFDRVFGKKHLSWRCFTKSGLASYAMVCVVVLFSGGPIRPYMLLASIEYGFFANVIPDYVSPLESRYVLRFMSRTESGFRWLRLVILDLILTSLIALVATHVILSTMWEGNNPLQWAWSFTGFYDDFHRFA